MCISTSRKLILVQALSYLHAAELIAEAIGPLQELLLLNSCYSADDSVSLVCEAIIYPLMECIMIGSLDYRNIRYSLHTWGSQAPCATWYSRHHNAEAN